MHTHKIGKTNKLNNVKVSSI